MRDKLLSAHAFLGQCTVSDSTRIKREDRGATTILTRRPGHCGRPAPELRSVAQLPKVFIGGFRWTRSGRYSSGLRGFEAEILQSGATGLQPPQIDGEEPGASHHGFLAGGSAGGRSEERRVGKGCGGRGGGGHREES